MSHSERWIQQLRHYERAFRRLEEAVELSRKRTLNELELQGMIQAFEFTHELAWKTLKDYLEHMGSVPALYGSRDTTREAFRLGLITDGQAWMNMIKSRNETSHTYNEELLEKVVYAIVNDYYPAFAALLEKLHTLEQRS
jgi:nucleotidyltransferase substrate binding protein (TIGR01987 family)